MTSYIWELSGEPNSNSCPKTMLLSFQFIHTFLLGIFLICLYETLEIQMANNAPLQHAAFIGQFKPLVSYIELIPRAPE